MQHPNKRITNYKKLYRLYDDGTVFTAIDTETTALSPRYGRVIEIGAVKFTKDGILEKWQSLFCQDQPLPYQIVKLTHITDEMLCGQPRIEEKIASIYSFIKDTVLIAHNAQFDLNFINAEFELAKYPVSKNKFIDTLAFSKTVFPELEHHRLDFLADHFKINKGSSHRAFDDAVTCMELFKVLVENTRQYEFSF